MNIIPTINLMQGKCVHVSGEYLDTCHTFSDDPIDLAGRWMDRGVKDLYVFDVEGALRGEAKHRDIIISIAQRFPNLSLHVEGGIRSEASVEDYLKAGVKSVTLGSQAIDDPAFVVELCKRFPEQIKVSLTLNEGLVRTEGGKNISSISASVWASQLSGADIGALIYRDSARVGLCQGVNIDEAVRLAKVSRAPLWISGGVADMDDIRALYSESDVGIEAVLISRALDEKSLSLNEAQDYCEE
jgi:phosphoribosylformimino-5-aminoimidazole carboxamide ribotide isomerase